MQNKIIIPLSLIILSVGLVSLKPIKKIDESLAVKLDARFQNSNHPVINISSIRATLVIMDNSANLQHAMLVEGPAMGYIGSDKNKIPLQNEMSFVNSNILKDIELRHLDEQVIK